ncbi:hypothetical protein ABZ357_09590 [Streptomyces sp. NPDC005917]|uniref:hypothetical protein n=1 Tax=unclassified Streptomyces TaxID=2593676 RepID=UPI0033CA66CC
MTHLSTRREHRTNRRAIRATLRRRAAETRLAASCRRRPRSLPTISIAAGVTNGLRSVAKRLGLAPAEQARTRRTVAGGRAHQTRSVAHWTLTQVRALLASYKPRKAEYVAAVAAFANTAV